MMISTDTRQTQCVARHRTFKLVRSDVGSCCAQRSGQHFFVRCPCPTVRPDASCFSHLARLTWGLYVQSLHLVYRPLNIMEWKRL